MEYITTISSKEYKDLITENTYLKSIKEGLDNLIKREILETLNYYVVDKLSLEEIDAIFGNTPDEIKNKYFYVYKIETFIQKFGFAFKNVESIDYELFRTLSDYIYKTKKAKEIHAEGIDAA